MLKNVLCGLTARNQEANASVNEGLQEDVALFLRGLQVLYK